MLKPVIAVYPGTFDPVTLGHQDLIRRAASLFGTVIVAVAAAHHKKTLFSLEERLDTVREVVGAYPNVQVESFNGLVRDFAVDHGAKVMLRGVRSVTDFDFENQLAGMNRALAPDVETVFLTPDARYQHISSTLVREIATLKGDVLQFVAPTVHARLMQKLGML
jgi:pantetheine-phosphate adenylyltransferase